MICIARGLGAPESVPAGKQAVRTSKADRPSATRPVTVETMCITWLYFSTDMKSTTSTLPGAQTRPRSLRPRSTSIRCSARSLGSASSSAASSASSCGLAPRCRVPAMGCTMAWPPVTLTRASGLEPTTSKPPSAVPSGPGKRNRYM